MLYYLHILRYKIHAIFKRAQPVKQILINNGFWNFVVDEQIKYSSKKIIDKNKCIKIIKKINEEYHVMITINIRLTIYYKKVKTSNFSSLVENPFEIWPM